MDGCLVVLNTRLEVLDVSPYDFHSDELNVCPALGIQPLPVLGVQPLIPILQYVKSTEFSDINYASYTCGACLIPTLVSTTYQASGAKNILRD